MVDVISAHLGAWKHANLADQNSTKAIERKGNVPKKRKSAERTILKAAREASLYDIKEIPCKSHVTIVNRPFVGLSCLRCTPGTREKVSSTPKQTSIINILQFGKDFSAHSGFLSRGFCDIIQACRVRKYNFVQVADAVIKDDRLKQAVDQVTQDTLNKIETGKLEDPKYKEKKPSFVQIHKDIENRAKSILLNLRSTLSDLTLRVVSWLLYKLLPSFISSICASPQQFEMLKKANESGLPLIFVPLHRSHLDYILVTFILLNNNIRCPLVAAGDNLKIPFFGWLLRNLGAFYIKRRLETNGTGEKDILYRATLHTYIIHCLAAQHNMEFYIEGGRSRTGKPLLPKSGILSVIVDAYLDGTVDDAYLVPVSLNYDKIVDGNFVTEQTGAPKQMESFTVAVKSMWKIANSHYGNIRIDFNQPFSLKELVQTFQQNPSKLSPMPLLKSPTHEPFNNFARQNSENSITLKKLSAERCLTSRQSCSSLYGTDVVVEERRGLVEAIARHVVYDSTIATAVMSTNAVAYILLTKYREGCSIDQLASEISVLTKKLHQMNRDVGFTGEPVNIANHAVDLLGPSTIKREKTLNGEIIKPVLDIPNIIELSYYCNSVLPHIAMECIIVTVLQTFVAESRTSSTVRFKYNELVEGSLQLCEIMSQEFILSKPCQDLENSVIDVIEKLSGTHIIEENVKNANEQSWCRQVANALDEDGDFKINDPDYCISIEQDVVQARHQLQCALRPLIETYSITASCLCDMLLAEDGMTESEFVKIVLKKITNLIESKECKFGEALSSDAIKNCLRLLRQWNVLEVQSFGKIRKLYLSRRYRKELEINKIQQLINRFMIQIP